MTNLTPTNAERSEADKYAYQGLDGDDRDHCDRMRCFAYAQVKATIFTGDQLERLADTLGELSAALERIAESLEAIESKTP